jgi:hypothetical protein
MTSQANACSYCMGSVVLILSQIYLYSSYSENKVKTLVVLDDYGATLEHNLMNKNDNFVTRWRSNVFPVGSSLQLKFFNE